LWWDQMRAASELGGNDQAKQANQAADLALWEPEEGFEPSTFRLRVETHPSSRYQPDLSWLLPSSGSSSQCVPDLPCYGRRNDRENDQVHIGVGVEGAVLGPQHLPLPVGSLRDMALRSAVGEGLAAQMAWPIGTA
jgi:hypothetical protein